MKKPITWIHPDPNQPRKYIIDSEVADLAATLETEGLIHPIEVDPSGKIVVGERRWRAMKKAGWKVVEEGKQFIINNRKLTPYERLRRQIIENIHHSSLSGGASTMDALDEAKAFKRMIDYGGTATAPYGAKTLARDIKVPEATIRSALSLLEESPAVKKAIRKSGGKGKSFYLDANRLRDEKKREQLKQWILKGKVSTQSIIRDIVDRANTYPELSLSEVLQQIKDDADRRASIEEASAKDHRVLDATSNAIQVLAQNPLEETHNKKLVVSYVKMLQESCRKYLHGDAIEGKVIER